MGWTTPPYFVNVAPILGAVSPPTWGELGMYFAAVISVVGVIITATVTRRTGQEANAVSFSKTLLDRIESLEDDIQELKEGQKETASIITAFTVFTEALFRWGRGGGGEPEPTVPKKLRERLEHLINEQHHNN